MNARKPSPTAATGTPTSIAVLASGCDLGSGLEAGLGDALRPAPPMNQARILGLGLSVGVAIALAGCEQSRAFPGRYAQEASDIEYSIVRQRLAQGDEGAVKLAPAALADGRLTQGEYDDIILYKSDSERGEYLADKRALINDFAGGEK